MECRGLAWFESGRWPESFAYARLGPSHESMNQSDADQFSAIRDLKSGTIGGRFRLRDQVFEMDKCGVIVVISWLPAAVWKTLPVRDDVDLFRDCITMSLVRWFGLWWFKGAPRCNSKNKLKNRYISTIKINIHYLFSINTTYNNNKKRRNII